MSPVALLQASSASNAGVFAHYEWILSGYRHHDFPDLSLRRFAPDILRSVSQSLGQNPRIDTTVSLATVTAVVGRVLGAYCGCQDVLLGIAAGHEDKLLPVRVAWSNLQTWEDVVAGVAVSLKDPHWPRVHPELLRRALDLAPKQPPVLAIVSTGALHRPSSHHHPLVVVVNQEAAVLSIMSSERSCHPSQSKLLASQIAALIKHAIAVPKSSINHLPQLSTDLISSYEKRPLEQRLKHSSLVPRVTFATDYLTLQATEQPDGIAVRWYSDLATDVPISAYIPETITNAKLEEKANKLGRWLIQIGLQKGRSVAVCMKRDICFHIAFIGILRAGGCYVPIDPELPVERQQFIVKDADVQFILSTVDMLCFRSLGDKAIDVVDRVVQDAIEDQSAEVLMVPQLEDASYILYTSGTTGTPKGCILTHKGLIEAIWALSQFCAAAELSPHGRVNYLSIASVAFDVHIAEVMVALAVGIPILSAPRSLLLEDLPYYIKHLRISHVGIVPSLIEATMGLVEADETFGVVTTLRYIASGGEKMSDAILDKWANHPKVRLANFYGPSEVTIGCAARMMDRNTPRANIGHPFENTSAYVVDEHMDIVLRGGSGELVVEGPLVGRGYVRRPDLTERVFLRFPDDGTGRWAYRTGDLVRMMADGTLEIIGRIDTQIKLRGVRIESEGISSILRNAYPPPHTLDVVTTLAKHPAIGIDQVVSFIAWNTSVPVTIRKGGKPSLVSPPPDLLQILRSACDRELASYMRPSHIIPLNFIPLSSNGKADAKVLSTFFLGLNMESLSALMSGEQPSTTSDDDCDEPTVATEKQLIEILAPYIKLPVRRPGPRMNLFECGMDSLAITRLAGDLRRTFSTNLSLAQIMQAPTVGGIVALLESGYAPAVSDTSVFVGIPPAIREEVEAAYPPESVATLLPPFPVQEGILYRSANSPTMYVQHVLLRLVPEVSVSGLRDAWRKLVIQIEMLRTVFYFGNTLIQVVLRTAYNAEVADKTISQEDHQHFKRYFIDNEASSIARELNAGISKTPPVRLTLFVHPSSSTPYMVLSIHHALYDGISLPVLLQNLERVYTRQPQLPSTPLRGILDQVIHIDQVPACKFWSSYLKDFSWKHLLNRGVSSSTADVVKSLFTRTLSELQNTAARQHVTLQALLMCAYGSLLAQHLYGHDDVVFGVIRAGRSIPVDNVETTVCPMITVVPARVRLTDPSGVLQTVQQDIARVSEFEHVSLSDIQKWVPGCDGALCDTLFSLSYKEKEGSQLWSVLESHNPEPDFILAVEVVLDPEQDKVAVHAAFTSADISPTLVDTVLSKFEETAIRMAEGGANGARSLSNGANITPSQAPIASKTPEAVDDVVHVDDALVSKISTIASQFLNTKSSYIMPGTSLLSLGLDSIKSVGLSRRLSREGLEIYSADIMRLSTPYRLATFIQRAEASARGDWRLSKASFATTCNRLKGALNVSEIRLSEHDDVRVYPTSVLQAGMLSQTITSNGRLYVHLFPLHLARDIDLNRLRESWNRVILSYDILRTSFHFLPGLGTWAQVVHSSSDLQWIESRYDAGANLAESLNPFLGTINKQEPFQHPPIFLYLLRATAPEDTHRLVIVLHHVLYDGLSIARLLHIIQGVYCGLEVPSATHFHQLLPRLLWQEHNGTAFWIDRLRDLHHAPIPRKHPASPDGVHQVSLPVRFTEEEIRRACRDSEVTPQCLGQAAFATLLAVLTQRRDVVFGRVVAGRDMLGAEDVIGPMLNTVPCRVVLDEGVRNKALLRQVHGANVACMPWQHASLRAIQQELHMSSLWDSLYVFQPRQESLESQTDDAIWIFDTAEAVTEDISIQYPLNVELHESDDGFVVKAACKADIASVPEFQSLINLYASILCDIVRRPDGLWSDGLPEITEIASLAENGSTTVLSEKDDEGWDSRFETFREVLSASTKITPSNIHTNTFLATLGIDSITAVQIVAKTRRIGLRLTAAEIVQSKTVGDLLKRVSEAKTPAPNGVVNTAIIDVPRARWSAFVPPHVANEVERVVHASAGMEWMVGMWQRSGGTRFQHVFSYRLPASVDASRLENAWNALVRRHAVLRATFAYDGEAGTPRVVIFKPETLVDRWSQELVDSSEDVIAAAERRMKELVSHHAPLDRPLTRAVFLRNEHAAFLLLHLHHFQYDAWSLQLLVDDLSSIHAGKEAQSSDDLEGFLRFAYPTIEAEEEQAKYWRSALRTPQLFPPIRKGQSHWQDRIVYTDPAALTEAAQLDKRARELAVSLQSVFLACWAQVQARGSATEDVTIFLWHSGRTGDLKDVERLAAPCINALPFFIQDAKTGDTIALARRIQDDLQARSAIVEQTRLVKIHEWTGFHDKPLANVFVNIVKIAPGIDKKTDTDVLFNALDVPYHIPEVASDAIVGTFGIGNMPVTNLLRDDIMVEIIVMQKTNQVLMSIESAGAVLGVDDAKNLLEEWVTSVNIALGEKP